MTTDEIEKMLSGATPGPWTAGLLMTDLHMERQLKRATIKARYYLGYAVWPGNKKSAPVVCLVPAGDADHRSDAELMAAAPYLAAEVLRLRAALEQNRAET
jgi:hypothetical protein